jgi:hypothetical protein
VRELITAALAGKPCAALEHLELENALNYGGLAVLRDAWQRFGLDRALAAIPDAHQRGLLQAMIFGRVLRPISANLFCDISVPATSVSGALPVTRPPNGSSWSPTRGG